MGPKLGPFGLKIRSKIALLFESCFEAILDPPGGRFGLQVGGQKPPKPLEGCSKSAFPRFRVGARFGSLSGSVLGLFWGPTWTPKRLQEGSKTRSKLELNFEASWEPSWADLGLHLGPRNGSKTDIFWGARLLFESSISIRLPDAPGTPPRGPRDPPTGPRDLPGLEFGADLGLQVSRFRA